MIEGSGRVAVDALIPARGYSCHRDIAYGELPRHTLDVYVPDTADDATPVVVFIHGGGWESGNKNGYKFLGQALTSIGCVVVVANYRLYPQVSFPDFVEDAAAAAAWAQQHVAEYGGDPDNLFLMGHSAGAHITGLLALDPRYLDAAGGDARQLAGWIGLAGPYDFLPSKLDTLNDMFAPPDNYHDAQPINFASGNTLPILLMTGAADRTVSPRNSRKLADAIKRAGGQASLRSYAGVGHIRIMASFAYPLRFLGSQLQDVEAFIKG